MGVLREKAKVKVIGTVTGGNNESSIVQWYKSHSSTLDEINLEESLSNSTTVTKAFRIPLGAVGYYIVAKFTPMSSDGRSGEPTFVISNRTIDSLPPSLNFLEITGNYHEGGILTASYEYIGGHEGKSIYDWYIHEDEDDFGSPISGVSGLVEYRTTKEVIGKFISFQCTPVRDDGDVGEKQFAWVWNAFAQVEQLLRNDQHRLKIVVDSENESDLMVQFRHIGDVIFLVIRGIALLL